MVIQAETYPGYGYQQQRYSMAYDAPYYFSPTHSTGQYSRVQVAPATPYITNPYPSPYAATYPQQPSAGWYDVNKHQSTTGWQSPAHGGWPSEINKHQTKTGWQSPTHDSWTSDINKHQSSGWNYSDYYSHESNSNVAYNYNNINDGYQANENYGYEGYGGGGRVPSKIEHYKQEGHVSYPSHDSVGIHNDNSAAEWKFKSIDD